MCLGCNTERPTSEFHRETKRKDGLATQCKICRHAHYLRSYDRRKPMIRASAASIRKRNTEVVNKAKDVPCADCGIKYPSYVMDFDHLDPALKIKNVSLLKAHSLEKLYAEIAKCEVVCSNCHRIRTHAPVG